MQKILIIGSGGREHAFAWKLNQSDLCEKLYIAPGNAGTMTLGENVDIDPEDFVGIRSFILAHDITMVVVGPEVPLVKGIYDFIKADDDLKNIIVVGPSAEGAKLEGSKSFAKKFMDDYGIPTAGYLEVTQSNIEEGLQRIDTSPTPIVLKADGLAAGKGVLILEDRVEAKQALKDMLGGKFGTAGEKVVIEDFLNGIEFSVFVLTDGKDYKILPIAKDYKRIGEGDTGLNTGGMGAISPVSFADQQMMNKVETQVIIPTIKGIQHRNIVFKGFIFLGLISVGGEPYVIEYNCRMGDPETEVVLPRLESDLIPLFEALDTGNLKNLSIEIKDDFAATMMLVSGGYPESYQKGFPVSGVEALSDCIVFHAGTKLNNGTLVTNGGRVIAITALGRSQEDALQKAMAGAQKVEFSGKYFRTDIGFDL